RRLTGGMGVERAVDCSANDQARATAIRATRKWGRIVFLGEGGRVEFHPSPDIIHDQKTIYGSWVTSTWLMEELVERLVRWNLHPADLVTHRFSLDNVDRAYTLMASGKCGKVAVCFDEKLWDRPPALSTGETRKPGETRDSNRNSRFPHQLRRPLPQRVDGRRVRAFVGGNLRDLLQNVPEFVHALNEAVLRKGVHRKL